MLRLAAIVLTVLLPRVADAACKTIARRHAPKPIASARPAFAISVQSTLGYPFSVHGPAGSQATLNKIRDAADDAWQAEIASGNWPAPPPDTKGPDSKFDIYVDPSLEEGEAWVDEDGPVASTPWDDAMSFMALPPTFPNDAALWTLVSHELNHASQYAMDAHEDDAFFEQTATLVEMRTGGDFATYGVGIPDFQKYSARAIDFMGNDYYQYGAMIWLAFLTEAVGGGSDALAKRLWEDGKQTNTTNEPDHIDVLPAILADHGWTMSRFWATFAIWRYFTDSRDDGAHFVQGAEWGATSLIKATKKSFANDAVQIDAVLSPFGVLVYEIPSAAVELEWTAGATAAFAVQPLDAAKKAIGDPLLPETPRFVLPAGTQTLIVGVAYVPAAYDPDANAWATQIQSVTLTIVGPGGATGSTGSTGATGSTGSSGASGSSDDDDEVDATSTTGASSSSSSGATSQKPTQKPADPEPAPSGCSASGAAWWLFVLVVITARSRRSAQSYRK